MHGAASAAFHVGGEAIPSGQVLRSYTVSEDYAPLIRRAVAALDTGPGAIRRLLVSMAFTRLRDLGGYRAEMVVLEAIFEHARVRVSPQAFSRLEAVYTWGSLTLAERFRAAYRPAGIIHRCAVRDGTTMERDGALIAAGINLARPIEVEVPRVEQRAIQYWRACEPMALPEVLVRGTVVVEEIVPS